MQKMTFQKARTGFYFSLMKRSRKKASAFMSNVLSRGVKTVESHHFLTICNAKSCLAFRFKAFKHTTEICIIFL